MSEPTKPEPAHATPPGAAKPSAAATSTVDLPKAPQVPVLHQVTVPPKWTVVPLPPAVLPAAAVAGLAAAILLPLGKPGIGWVLTGLVLAAGVVVVDRRSREAGTPQHFTKASAGWGLLALALLAVGAYRDSGWLFVLCVLAACLCGSLAVVGGRTVNTLVYDVLAVPVEALRGLPWVGKGLGALALRRAGTGQRVVFAVLATAGLLAVFVPLLSSADETFAQLVSSLVPDIDPPAALRWGFVFVAAGLGLAGACYLLASPPHPAVDTRPVRAGHRLEWALPLGVLVLLFAVFVAVRLVVLFGGTGYVLRTDGLTSAEYARGGFWQLCAVTVLTLALVAAALRWAPNATAKDRVWQRTMLGALSVLSLVLVVSALSRMWTYQEAYGFTVLRVLVEVCELWLGVVFLLVLASLVRLRTAWLPRAAVGAAALALLALAVLDPERVIAGANIDRFAQGKPLDAAYLSRFSADVVPAAELLPEPRRSCVLRPVLDRLGKDGWTEWNASRSAARPVPVAGHWIEDCR
ncbi:DUF4153 domain-containing protein [Amycolatopsis sp. NPDC059027]|uniref:DUF4153 domain-containing protein n=1 Tax=Amycolatopsis sp. NPDC059027 TaxID=3346709 RepID=UPI00367199F4